MDAEAMRAQDRYDARTQRRMILKNQQTIMLALSTLLLSSKSMGAEASLNQLQYDIAKTRAYLE
jgi:hypothetical protein